MRPALLAALASLLALSLGAEPRHVVLLREATAAAQSGDNPTALGKLEDAASLRPDYPRIQLQLARLHAAAGHSDAALATLDRLAAMGIKRDVASDPTLAPLRSVPRFTAIAAQLAAGPAPVGTADRAAFAITGVTGIIESCLADPQSLLWYFGDVRNRCIWVRDVSGGTGNLRRFTSDADVLDGVFRIALSSDRSTLWAATATVGAMTGADAEDGKRTALVAIDFATGRVRSRHVVPADGRKHLLGDFVIAADGTLFAPDSLAPIIWRLAPGDERPAVWLESDEFVSLQGAALADDGRTLFVSDYANGIWRIDVATRKPALLRPPANASFFGLDGLYADGAALIAIQNGVEPQRVLRIVPASGDQPSTAEVLALGHPEMTDLALGTIFNQRLHFVANSGWSLFDPPPATPPAPRTVTIESIALAK